MKEPPENSLAASVIARALKLGVSKPGTLTTRMLFSEHGRRALVDAALVLDDPAPGALVDAARALTSLREPPRSDLESQFWNLFGHTSGRVCPYETEYGAEARVRQAQDLADVASYYGAFGLTPSRSDRIDHIGFELDFLEFLCTKEVYARESHDGEMTRVASDAARGFLRDHLGRFGITFGTSLAQEGGEGFYGCIGELLTRFLTVECRRRGLEALWEPLSLPTPGTDGPFGRAASDVSHVVTPL